MPIRSFLYSHCKLRVHTHIYMCCAHTHIFITYVNTFICGIPLIRHLYNCPLRPCALRHFEEVQPRIGATHIRTEEHGLCRAAAKSWRSQTGAPMDHLMGLVWGGISTCPNISKHKVPQLSMLLSGFEWFRILLNSIFPIEIATCSR